jgi:hypothetical protein
MGVDSVDARERVKEFGSMRVAVEKDTVSEIWAERWGSEKHL